MTLGRGPSSIFCSRGTPPTESQGHNLALTVFCVPYSLSAAKLRRVLTDFCLNAKAIIWPWLSSFSLLLSSLELSDTNVYEPEIRALLGTVLCVPYSLSAAERGAASLPAE